MLRARNLKFLSDPRVLNHEENPYDSSSCTIFERKAMGSKLERKYQVEIGQLLSLIKYRVRAAVGGFGKDCIHSCLLMR
jgi:hypothetical protein